MIHCHETCPFGLVWTSGQACCDGCGQVAARCTCHDLTVGKYWLSPTLVEQQREEWIAAWWRLTPVLQLARYDAPPVVAGH